MAFNKTFNTEEVARLKKLIQEGDQVLYEVDSLQVGLRETVKAIAEEATDRNLDASFFGSHLAECVIELAPGEERSISTVDISRIWRELTGPIPGVKQITFDSDLFTTGAPIEIQLSSVNRDDLKDVTTILKDKLQTYAGVFDIKDSFSAGKDEIKLN